MQQGDLEGAGLVTPCGGAGGEREGSQGGAGRIAGRLCLVIRWQGHQGGMLCTTRAVACTVWTLFEIRFGTREREWGRLAGPRVSEKRWKENKRGCQLQNKEGIDRGKQGNHVIT